MLHLHAANHRSGGGGVDHGYEDQLGAELGGDVDRVVHLRGRLCDQFDRYEDFVDHLGGHRRKLNAGEQPI